MKNSTPWEDGWSGDFHGLMGDPQWIISVTGTRLGSKIKTFVIAVFIGFKKKNRTPHSIRVGSNYTTGAWGDLLGNEGFDV